MRFDNCKYTRTQGFTLFELMVAVSIAVVVVSLMFLVVGGVLNQSQRCFDALRLESNFRKVEEKLSRDLQSLIWIDGSCGFIRVRLKDDCWGTENWSEVKHDEKPTVISVEENDSFSAPFIPSRWGKGGVVLELFTNNSTSLVHDPGGVYCVCYQLMRLGFSDSPRYVLTRSQVSAHQTFDEGYFFDGSEFESGEVDGDAFWAKSVIRNPNANHILCENVIDFGVKLYALESIGAWELLFPCEDNEVVLQKPELAVFELRVLTSVGARLISQIEQGFLKDDWWETAEKHSRIFSFQVPIPY